MKNIFVILAVFCVFAGSAAAQDLDPTVEVSREYEGKLVEVHKPVFAMAVPDSITRFALDFDYYVHENPYKGSYEFDPYLLSMKPSATHNGENSFYFRAGAGYQPHPTLDLVWSPKFRRRGFNMDVYGIHRSFIGNYWTIAPEVLGDRLLVTKLPTPADDPSLWYGYDMLSKAGMVFRHDWEKVAFDYSVGYYGQAQKDRQWSRLYNAADASFGIHTKPASRQSLKFDLDMDYRFGEDVVGASRLYENLAGLDMEISQMWEKPQSMNLGVEANVAYYSKAFNLFGGDVSLTPRYVFKNDRFSAEIGLKVSKLLTLDALNEQYVYPSVNVSCLLLPDALKFYLKSDGGGAFDSYSSTISENHHVTHLMSHDILGYTVERVGVTAGFDGRLTNRFTYDLRGGYINYASYRHYTVDASYQPAFSMVYSATQKCFAALDWLLDVEGFRFDGSVAYDYFFDGAYKTAGNPETDAYVLLKPVALSGCSSVEYNWRKRVVCGAEVDFSTGYMSERLTVPGYVDLGAYAEYATAWGLSFWVSVGNLLNQTIQRTPLYAEKGVIYTAGICLNL